MIKFMKFCPDCKIKSFSDVNFCRECGKELICPHIGCKHCGNKDIDLKDKFCTVCGQNI